MACSAPPKISFFDAVYQYPGGWIADRFGRRRALFFFLCLACAGYHAYLFGPTWPFAFLGLALVMGWQSMASPAIFAVIGDSLPTERRAMGFTVQSILKRVPVMIAPIVGGIIIASRGVVSGVNVGLLITLAVAALTGAVDSLHQHRQPATSTGKYFRRVEFFSNRPQAAADFGHLHSHL